MLNIGNADGKSSIAASRRATLLAGAAALIAIAAATPAQAQTAAPQASPPVVSLPSTQSAEPAAQPDDAATKDIVVTGSRITASGFTAPTPTTVISTADIAKNAEPNIFTTIAQLPSLQGSTGTTTGTNSTSSGSQGMSSFSLRGLGTIRTLTLLDGQRVVGANVTGVPDISLFPQLLIKRVDVVTGGASASYGSDAVGGVVNFITDKHFEGFKANVQGGETTYGDDRQYLIQAAAGHAFLDDRLHVEVSGEYDHEDGVGAGGFGEDAPAGRDWYRTSTLVNRGVTNDGSPQYLYRDHAQAYQYTKYGLITAGPLQGIAFDKNGKPFNFVYGSNGVPQKNAAGTVSGCYIGFCSGGDLSGNVGIGTTLQSSIKRWDGYSRVGFDLDSQNEIYATVNIARVETSNQPNPGRGQIRPDAFLLESVCPRRDPGAMRRQQHHQFPVRYEQRHPAEHPGRTNTLAISLRRRCRRADPRARFHLALRRLLRARREHHRHQGEQHDAHAAVQRRDPGGHAQRFDRLRRPGRARQRLPAAEYHRWRGPVRCGACLCRAGERTVPAYPSNAGCGQREPLRPAAFAVGRAGVGRHGLRIPPRVLSRGRRSLWQRRERREPQ